MSAPVTIKPTTRARRDTILAIVNRAKDGCTARHVLDEAEKLHAKGGWPQYPPEYAHWRQEPYYGGITQHMASMVRDGALVNIGGKPMTVVSRQNAEPFAHAALPDEEESEVILGMFRDYKRQTGLEVLIGVTPQLQRRLHIQTKRGVVEYELPELRTSWVDAVRRVLWPSS